jgi:UDP-N-acetylmuramate dehydrogenase
LKALEKTIFYLGDRSISYKVLGQGSNLLINDKGMKVIMSLAALNRINFFLDNKFEHEDPRQIFPNAILLSKRKTNLSYKRAIVSVEAGCRLQHLISWSIHSSLSGLENLSGIPASVGGAISTNAGTKGFSIAKVIDAVRFTGPNGSWWVKKNNLQFDYRSFDLPEGALISATRIKLYKSSVDQIKHRVRDMMRRRKTTQPLGKPSAGCVFKNPPGDSAGRLIDKCGLKGLKIGDAEVSKRHANFIVNCGKASAMQVIDLLELVKERVNIEIGLELVPEISFWGTET